MNNKIIYIAKEESETVRAYNKNRRDIFFVEIDGKKIQSRENFVEEMAMKFGFFGKFSPPTLSWWNEYMCDLLWIEKENIVLLISNFEAMLSNDPETKKLIVEYFEEIILPWWGGNVIGHMVGGYPREFVIYLEV